MNKVKFSIGVIAFAGLALLNFTQSENTFITNSQASTTSGGGSSSSDSNWILLL